METSAITNIEPVYLRPNRQRANELILSFTALFISSIFCLGSNIMEYYFMDKAVILGVDMIEAEANDTRQQIVNGINLIIYVVTVVLFIRWFRRAYYNLRELGVNTKYGDNMAVAAWFIPFLNFIRPFEIMKEIWQNTQSETIGKDHIEKTPLLVIWWVLWLICGILGQISFRYNATTIEEFIRLNKLNIFSDAITLITIIIIMTLIYRLRRMEDELTSSRKNFYHQ